MTNRFKKEIVEEIKRNKKLIRQNQHLEGLENFVARTKSRNARLLKGLELLLGRDVACKLEEQATKEDLEDEKYWEERLANSAEPVKPKGWDDFFCDVKPEERDAE